MRSERFARMTVFPMMAAFSTGDPTIFGPHVPRAWLKIPPSPSVSPQLPILHSFTLGVIPVPTCLTGGVIGKRLLMDLGIVPHPPVLMAAIPSSPLILDVVVAPVTFDPVGKVDSVGTGITHLAVHHPKVRTAPQRQCRFDAIRLISFGHPPKARDIQPTGPSENRSAVVRIGYCRTDVGGQSRVHTVQ